MKVLTLNITLKVPFYSTEDKTKIELIIKNLLGYLPELSETKIDDKVFLISDKVKIDSLKPFFLSIRQNEVLDTVRRCASIYPQEGTIIFNIHKQALTVNKIVVVTRDTTSSLGNLQLIIQTKDTEEFLNWFTPETFEGKILKNRKFNEIFNF